MTIYYPDGEILRKFDYDLYNENIFYYNIPGWIGKYIVESADFDYCFMNRDVVIHLKRNSGDKRKMITVK